MGLFDSDYLATLNSTTPRRASLLQRLNQSIWRTSSGQQAIEADERERMSGIVSHRIPRRAAADGASSMACSLTRQAAKCSRSRSNP